MIFDDPKEILFLIALVGMVVHGLLFVIFGQTTVRRLRKNPETRDLLGMELLSGWDILNVAGALSLPRSLARRVNAGPHPWMFANCEAMYRHTNVLERVIGRASFWSLYLTVAVLGIWAIALTWF